MMAAPRTAAEVRRQANEHIRRLGYRMQQVGPYILPDGTLSASYGEIARELDFYDRAGAYRAVKRLAARGG